LRVEERIEDDCRRCPIPPLLLQPLVENAVTHGIAALVDGGSIHLEARRVHRDLFIAIENDFDPDAPAGRKNGLGLANVRKRLAARYGDAARLDILRHAARYRIELTLPAETDRAG